VAYIPGGVNLFSEGVMDQNGFTIVRKNNKTLYYKNGQAGMEAEWSNGGYVMTFRPLREFANFSKESSSKLWHKRLVHVNLNYIQQSAKHGAVTGLKLEELSTRFNCDDCHRGNETRKPFPESRSPYNAKPGEVIHVDLSGKMPTPTLGGSSYFLLLKDGATGFRHVHFLKNKNEAAGKVLFKRRRHNS